jgi:hypothetical protein
MTMFGDLFRPFAYLTVKHPSGFPRWVNWLLPGLFSLALTWLVWHFDVQVNLLGEKGLLERLLEFIQTLAGFYIAALAAVASFNSPHLDKLMPSPAPTMEVKHNGVLQPVEATRRRFLSAMFAYLTALSFLFSLLAIAALTLADPLRTLLPTSSLQYLTPLGLFVILFAVAQMTAITFWGLFYLGERMLTPD